MARTILNYGILGTFKTSVAGQFARWLNEQYGGVTRMLTSDSGFGPVQEEIDAGIIHPWSLNSCTMPVAVVKRVSKGYWTADLNTRTGIGDEKKLVLTPESHWPLINGYIIEGITRNAELYRLDSERKDRKLGEPLQGSDLAVQQTELGEKYLMNSRATYQAAQRFTADYVERFKGLPCHWVMYTGHQSRGEDDNGRPCLGPEVAGKALNSVVGGWFENTLHSQQYRFKKKITRGGKAIEVETTGTKLFFMAHPDPDSKTLFWPAKLGVTPRIQARINNKYPEGFIPLLINENGEPTSGIRDLMDMIDPPPAVEGVQLDSVVSGEVLEEAREVENETEAEEGATDVVDDTQEGS